MNRLSKEKASYLRRSSYQKIDWYPWGEEAFQRARAEDRPVFLSSGASWCHWCHVMAKECFENDEIVELLNNHFICIKIDRDERPDIDRRYQQAVITMGSTGGWPLSVFLTPEGKPFFGGTYFPPEDREGSVGFKKILLTISEFYKKNKEDISVYTERLLDALKPQTSPKKPLNEGVIKHGLELVLSSYDPQNGGFGLRPKFPMPGAIEFLLQTYSLTNNEYIGLVLGKTLKAMADGGFHDQIGGGFHRYSTDEAWIIPHFEKMADDNAWLLRNYISAYNQFGDEYFLEVARGIVSFVLSVLSDPEGGFYASMDADVSVEDEGGYFTWKEDELKEILSEDEFTALSLSLLHERGKMPHDPERYVLFVSMGLKELSERLSLGEDSLKKTLSEAKQKLLKARGKRQMPFVDKTLYTSINGLMCGSFLKSAPVLRDDNLIRYALRTINRILKERLRDGVLYHSEGVMGFLEDYVFLAEALILAYELTMDRAYLESSCSLIDACIEGFWDKDGGFFDSSSEVLGLRLKAIEDLPHPSQNSLSGIILTKLYHITKDERYKEIAEALLESFLDRTETLGIHAGYYYSALSAYYNMKILRTNSKELALPAFVSRLGYFVISYEDAVEGMIPCFRETCYEPLSDISEVEDFLKNWIGGDGRSH